MRECVCDNVFVELSKMAPNRIQITPPPVREKSCVCGCPGGWSAEWLRLNIE